MSIVFEIKCSSDNTKTGKVVGSCNIYERQCHEEGHVHEGYEYYHNEMYNPIAIVLQYEDGSRVREIRDKERVCCCGWVGGSRGFIDSGHWDLDRLFNHSDVTKNEEYRMSEERNRTDGGDQHENED